MNTSVVPAGSIVVGVDGSVSAARALDWGVDQALAERRPLTLVHAVGPLDGTWTDQTGTDSRVGLNSMHSAARKLLEETCLEAAHKAPDLEIRDLLLTADPRRVLVELSERAAMVVLGSRGRGPVRSILLGSVGLAVMRHTSCPVVIHRPENLGRVRNGILVGVDGSTASLATLEFAYRQASLRQLPLTVLHSFWDPRAYPNAPELVVAQATDLDEERLLLSESMAGMGEKYPDVPVRAELARGLAEVRLNAMSDRMNMIVVGGHHGSVASEMFFGSVAASVVEHATCAVAVVPRPTPTL